MKRKKGWPPFISAAFLISAALLLGGCGAAGGLWAETAAPQLQGWAESGVAMEDALGQAGAAVDGTPQAGIGAAADETPQAAAGAAADGTPQAGAAGDGALSGEAGGAANGSLQAGTGTASGERILHIETETASGDGQAVGEDGGDGGSFGDGLLLAGDIYLSDHVLRAYDQAGGIDGVLDAGLQAEIGNAGIFAANQEFPFSDRGTAAADKEFTFRLPTARISVLQEIGPDLVTLANNHALDYGTEALLDTCLALDGAGILRVGAGASLEEAKRAEVVELSGLRVGFLGASRVFPTADWAAGTSHPGMLSAYNEELLLETIRQARETCDYLVVCVHWGIERETTPKDYQRSLGYRMIDAGADLVVGSHPHVLQGIEFYKGKPILYSLGNFVFGSSIPETMLVRAKPDGDGGTQLTLIPATSSAGYTRELPEEKRAAFYEKMESLSFGVEIDGATGQVFPAEAAYQSP